MKDSLIILPTYNERENIIPLIKAILHNFTQADILIVDDGSPDGTAQAAASLQPTYPQQIHIINRGRKMGLGTAYIVGFQFALDHSYTYIFTMDADFSHPVDKIKTLYAACQAEGYDVAIGSRYIEGISVAHWPLGRIILSYYANCLARLITGVPIRDLTAGFQCYRRAVLQAIDLAGIQSIGYSFQVEMKFLAWKHQCKIKEIPIVFTNRIHGHSKMSHRIILEALYRIILLKLKSLYKNFKAYSTGRLI
jgi:dolichol-phosphate mannosyltransferase